MHQADVSGFVLSWDACLGHPEDFFDQSAIVDYAVCLRSATGAQLLPCQSVGMSLKFTADRLTLPRSGEVYATVTCTNKVSSCMRPLFAYSRIRVHA